MKELKILKAWTMVSLLFFSFACKDDRPRPTAQAGAKPGVVSNVRVTATNGGAILHYTLPKTDDLSYILARFEYPAGVIKEFKSSKFVDSLVLEGFGDTNEYPIELFAVTKSEVKSDPIAVSVKPLKPIAQVVMETLEMFAAFGGVEVRYDGNTRQEPLAIHVIKKVNGDWEDVDVNFIDVVTGSFKSRGQDPEPAEFGVYVRDRWNNYSDTLIQTHTPFLEEKITSAAGSLALASDYNKHYSGGYAQLFDNNLNNSLGTLVAEGVSLPLSMTVEFDKSYKLSRMQWYMGTDIEYSNGSVENFEIYGSNELVDDWSKWTKIMDCTIVKPSGLPLNSTTPADIAHASKGIDFDFPAEAPPYKYLRFNMLNTFDYVNYYRVSELMFWGSGAEEDTNPDGE